MVFAAPRFCINSTVIPHANMIFSSLLSASLAAPVANPASEMTKEKYDKLPTKLVFKDVTLNVVAYCASHYSVFGDIYDYEFQTIEGTDSEGKLKFDDRGDLTIAGVGTLQRMGYLWRTRFNRNDQTLYSPVTWEKFESSLESTERYRYKIESSPNKKPVTLKDCNKDNSKDYETGKWGYVTKFTAYYDTITFTKNDRNAPDPIE
jgi:hypothetical protein